MTKDIYHTDSGLKALGSARQLVTLAEGHGIKTLAEFAGFIDRSISKLVEEHEASQRGAHGRGKITRGNPPCEGCPDTTGTDLPGAKWVVFSCRKAGWKCEGFMVGQCDAVQK